MNYFDAWDGFLPTGETWSGPVSGSLSRTFDNNFRVTGIGVDGQTPTAYTYDADGLLTGAGSLTLARDPQTGLLTGSTLGSVTDSRTTTSYGELETYSAAYPAGLSVQDQYTHDAAGRIIIGKVETINGTQTAYGYTYDQDGRLTDVTVNGSPYSHYGYDSNGNRIITDHLGSPRFVIDQATGNIAERLDYDAFDNVFRAIARPKRMAITLTGMLSFSISMGGFAGRWRAVGPSYPWTRRRRSLWGTMRTRAGSGGVRSRRRRSTVTISPARKCRVPIRTASTI